MDNLKEDFFAGLREAVRRAGSQAELARLAGMQQGRISDYLTERYDFDNITVGTLRKIFPDLKMSFLPQNTTRANVEEDMELQVLEHFRGLSSKEKSRYMMLMAANFPHNIVTETKK